MRVHLLSVLASLCFKMFCWYVTDLGLVLLGLEESLWVDSGVARNIITNYAH